MARASRHTPWVFQLAPTNGWIGVAPVVSELVNLTAQTVTSSLFVLLTPRG